MTRFLYASVFSLSVAAAAIDRSATATAQMFIPKGVERILKTAPPGADLTSWRY